MAVVMSDGGVNVGVELDTVWLMCTELEAAVAVTVAAGVTVETTGDATVAVGAEAGAGAAVGVAVDVAVGVAVDVGVGVSIGVGVGVVLLLTPIFAALVGLSLSCIRMCFLRSPERAHDLAQMVHVKGFSPGNRT